MSFNPTLIVIAILFSALFSGMEIAFISANRLRLELDRKRGTLSSRIIGVFTRNPRQYIATLLVGNNIALVIYGIEMARLLYTCLLMGFDAEVLEDNPLLVFLLQVGVSTALIIITAEFIPKSLFRIHPNGYLKFFAPPMLFFYYIFYPISRLTTWLSVGILRKVLRQKIEFGDEQKIFSRIDLDHLVGEAAASSDQEQPNGQEIKIFQNALDFSTVRLRDCMIPRTDIEAVEVDTPIEELRAKFVESNYSRILVFKQSVDNIIGYINCKDLFRKPQSIRAKLLRIDFVPDTMLANKLLTLFIKNHKSIAIVVDEFGGTAGLVTIEDLIEEIFGEIDDEHDHSELVEKQLNSTDFILSGRLEVEYLNTAYKLGIPESDEYDTLAGFIINHLQNIPKPQERIAIDRFKIRVARMDGNRIDLIHLSAQE